MIGLFGSLLGSLLPSAVSGSFGVGSQIASNQSNERINQQQIQASKEINDKNLALSQEALSAQKSQQSWANEQYIESRDYDRALQQNIFNREDTAIMRAVDDARNAGFSPLAALGMPANSGAVVSSSSAPGSMVSNNQANLSVPNLRADDYGNLAQAGGQIAQILATTFESQKAQDNQVFVAEMQLAQQAKEAGLGRLHEEIMKSLEHDFLRSQENQKYYNSLQLALQDEEIQSRLIQLQQSGAESLQGMQQTFQSNLQDDSQSHERQMAEDQRTGVGQRSELINQFINVVSEGDSKFARWLKDNKDIVTISLQLLSTFASN